jgi:hypothetical protein
MLAIVEENFRDKDGFWADETLICYQCGNLSEVYMVYSIDSYNNELKICKGCLSKGIQSIDNHYQAHMKNS